MPNVECRACNGTGRKTVKRTDSKGNTVEVEEDCKSCRGSGVIPT